MLINLFAAGIMVRVGCKSGFALLLAVVFVLSGCSTQTPHISTKAEALTAVPGDIRLLGQLPDEVKETSGLAQREELLWTMNDSGDGAFLYALNTQFKIEQKVTVSNAKNVDWEELAQDQHYLYIADCGNNAGKRDVLSIYRVAWSHLNDKTVNEVKADIFKFSYADKPKPITRNHNFDCEALASVGNELWLFTKNRGDEKTKLYRLEKGKAFQTVQPSLEFDVKGLVTAADYLEESNTLVLIGYKKNVVFGQSFIWIIPVATEAEVKPLWEKAHYQTLTPYAQWEAVLWQRGVMMPDLLFTTEKSPLLDVSIGVLKVNYAFDN